MQQLLVLMTVVCTDMRHSPSCSQAYRDAEQRKSHVAATWQPAGLYHLYQQPCQLFGAAGCEVTDHVHAVQVVRAFRQGACTCYKCKSQEALLTCCGRCCWHTACMCLTTPPRCPLQKNTGSAHWTQLSSTAGLFTVTSVVTVTHCSSSDVWKLMPLVSQWFRPYRHNVKIPGKGPEPDHQGGTDLQSLVKWLDC